MYRGYYYTVPNISVIDKKGIFPLDLARKTVFDTFTVDDNVVAEFCKHRIAQLLVNGEKAKHCIFNKRGFIPKERSFVLNVNRPVYLIGKGDSTYEVAKNFSQYDVAIGFFNAEKKTYSKNIDNEITGENLANNSIVTEIWVNNSIINIPKTVSYLPPKNMIHFIDESGIWCNSLPIPSLFIGKNVNLVIKYTPLLIKAYENNIMYEVVQELLPNHINGGWIPFDEKEREAVYSDTYNKLERYIASLKAERKK